MRLYRIDDQKVVPGVYECDITEAKVWNDRNWGIFFTPNVFDGARKASNLRQITSWYIDIDNCDKNVVLDKLKGSPAKPSTIIETKSGYHAYWFAKDAKVDDFEDIERRLIYHFNADPQVKDVSRLLRVPNFYHCKDIENRFLIKTILLNERVYTQAEMRFAFKEEPKEKPKVYEETELTSLDGVDLNILLKPDTIVRGHRNSGIFNKGVFLKKIGLGYNDVERALFWLNSNISDPLPEREVALIIKGYNSWGQ